MKDLKYFICLVIIFLIGFYSNTIINALCDLKDNTVIEGLDPRFGDGTIDNFKDFKAPCEYTCKSDKTNLVNWPSGIDQSKVSSMCGIKNETGSCWVDEEWEESMYKYVGGDSVDSLYVYFLIENFLENEIDKDKYYKYCLCGDDMCGELSRCQDKYVKECLGFSKGTEGEICQFMRQIENNKDNPLLEDKKKILCIISSIYNCRNMCNKGGDSKNVLNFLGILYSISPKLFQITREDIKYIQESYNLLANPSDTPLGYLYDSIAPNGYRDEIENIYCGVEYPPIGGEGMTDSWKLNPPWSKWQTRYYEQDNHPELWISRGQMGVCVSEEESNDSGAERNCSGTRKIVDPEYMSNLNLNDINEDKIKYIKNNHKFYYGSECAYPGEDLAKAKLTEMASSGEFQMPGCKVSNFTTAMTNGKSVKDIGNDWINMTDKIRGKGVSYKIPRNKKNCMNYYINNICKNNNKFTQWPFSNNTNREIYENLEFMDEKSWNEGYVSWDSPTGSHTPTTGINIRDPASPTALIQPEEDGPIEVEEVYTNCIDTVIEFCNATCNPADEPSYTTCSSKSDLAISMDSDSTLSAKDLNSACYKSWGKYLDFKNLNGDIYPQEFSNIPFTETPSYNKDSDNTTYLNSFEESLKKRKDPDRMYKFIYTGDESSPNDYVEFSPSIFNGISCKT